jgi:hypothetical protein
MEQQNFVSEGLRWIASLFRVTAELLGRESSHVPYEEYISDVRNRIQSRYY